MNTRQSVFYIDDTGAVGDGTYVAVTATISSDTQIERETVEEKCRGEEWVAESAGHLKASITAELKFSKSSTVLQQFVTAMTAGTIIGIMDCTADRTVTGNQGLEMNALVKQLGMPKADGDYVKYNVTCVPHADNTDANSPRILTAA